MTADSKEPFEQQLQQALRDGETLDPATADRLAAARRRALDSADKPARPAWRHYLLPSGGLAAAAAIIAAILLQAPPPDTDPATLAQDELMVLAENYELLEDLEFYAWLETSDAHG